MKTVMPRLLRPIPLGLMGAAIMAIETTKPAGAEELPLRRPGLWQLTTVAETIGMKTFETCITQSDSIITGVGQQNCTTSKVLRLGDELYVDVECKTDSGKQKTSTVLTGDFATWYRAMSKMTFDPPEGGISNMGVTVDGKYLGSKCMP
ncbi:DUF3617 domain-containing protein [Hyphomicrobium facile]|uniref:DUF3617 family protein n=1 Tax=Hyphomicrobium facile TaxID=51670 RepID=A0A1I7NH81_9HYPH|nr:DUF3617 family protein [Hyphomicrobium facile]SFV34019.1 Protein of unknown function [Hyphomicrobium facile]